MTANNESNIGTAPGVVPVEMRVRPDPRTSENPKGHSYGKVLQSKDCNSLGAAMPATDKRGSGRSLADLEKNWRVNKRFNVQSRDATPAQSKAKGSRGKYIPPFQRNRGESKSNSPSEKLKRLRYNPEPKRSKLYKTQLCETYKEFGECKYGSNCQYAHGKEELREKPAPYRPSAYKTVRCKNYWSKDSICPYGSKCRFIHEEATGIDERKVEKMKNHSKYKTQECKTFKELGTCPYGDKCAFIHKPKVVQCIECTDAPINFLTKTTGRITSRRRFSQEFEDDFFGLNFASKLNEEQKKMMQTKKDTDVASYVDALATMDSETNKTGLDLLLGMPLARQNSMEIFQEHSRFHMWSKPSSDTSIRQE